MKKLRDETTGNEEPPLFLDILSRPNIHVEYCSYLHTSEVKEGRGVSSIFCLYK